MAGVSLLFVVSFLLASVSIAISPFLQDAVQSFF